MGKPSLPTRRETWYRDHRCHPSLALPVPRGLEQVEQVQAGLPGWLQVPRALLPAPGVTQRPTEHLPPGLGTSEGAAWKQTPQGACRRCVRCSELLGDWSTNRC